MKILLAFKKTNTEAIPQRSAPRALPAGTLECDEEEEEDDEEEGAGLITPSGSVTSFLQHSDGSDTVILNDNKR